MKTNTLLSAVPACAGGVQSIAVLAGDSGYGGDVSVVVGGGDGSVSVWAGDRDREGGRSAASPL